MDCGREGRGEMNEILLLLSFVIVLFGCLMLLSAVIGMVVIWRIRQIIVWRGGGYIWLSDGGSKYGMHL